jgi:serine protease Do
MSATNSKKQNNSLLRHRLILLTSAAVLGATMLFAGPGGYAPIGIPSSVSSARAADSTITHPEGFADLVAKVKPAVISVRVKIDESAKMRGLDEKDQENIPFTPGSPMQKFFQQFGQNLPNGMQQHQMITGVGSRFFISSDGYAVTNNHVVDSAKSVQVTTDDGTIYTAKVIGTDPKSDIALIKVDGKKAFPYVKFADQEPRVGD